LNENVFRAGPAGVDDVTNALRKIQANAAEMKKIAE
jgi:hypothetical protein